MLSINCSLTLHLLSYEHALKLGYSAEIASGPKTYTNFAAASIPLKIKKHFTLF
jgi:hypothetical protein